MTTRMAPRKPKKPESNTPKVRSVLQIERDLHEALKVEASMDDVDMSDIVNDLLRARLATTVELLKRRKGETSEPAADEPALEFPKRKGK